MSKLRKLIFKTRFNDQLTLQADRMRHRTFGPSSKKKPVFLSHIREPVLRLDMQLGKKFGFDLLQPFVKMLDLTSFNC